MNTTANQTAANIAPTPPRIARADLPLLGQPMPGGIFAGLVLAKNGDTHGVILHTDAAFNGDWNAAMEWAKNLRSGELADFDLPTRHEQSVLFANCKDHFNQAWYWSSTQGADGHDDAWGQYFDNGRQDDYPKDCEGRCRAVRRLVIQ